MGLMRQIESFKNRFSGHARFDMQSNVRLFFGAFVVILTLIMILVMLHFLPIKQIELVVDGQTKIVRTKKATVQEMLTEQGIEIGEHDLISASLTDRVKKHERIEVRHAVPVTVAVDGRRLELQTTADTVGQLLEQADIELGALDIVEPGLDKSIRANDEIQIARIEKRVESETELIPYDIITREDPALARGKERIVQEGQDGLVEHVYERVYKDGQLLEEHLVESRTQRDVADQIVAVGTRSEVMILSAASPDVQTVTKDGISFGVKKIIEATLTAYDAGPESTGKTEDHPEYGITYTGTRVKEGRTAAVDPTVIPFGWWIYIEGYGFRRAEDKGSAIKGHWIDIYFDSHETAEKFGKKKGKVYIIGPEHPAEQS